MGELWCLSFSWLQGHTAQNARFAAYFPVKRHFRSSVDAADALPYIAPAQICNINVFKSKNEFGRALSAFLSHGCKVGLLKMRDFAAYFPVKRRFRSSVDAAVPCPIALATS